jgi:YfiH family protein
MIRPPGRDGVAFSERVDGDLRADGRARASFSRDLGVSDRWALVSQVHGAEVVAAGRPGDQGEADALWTTRPGLPLAVFTADCFGVVVHAVGAVGVAHAGWRGTKAGVVGELITEMERAGHPAIRAAIGPGIGTCCFEVGSDVAQLFPNHNATTSWETVSIDLTGALLDQLQGLDVWVAEACTLHEEGWFSHRRDATTERLAAVGWL